MIKVNKHLKRQQKKYFHSQNVKARTELRKQERLKKEQEEQERLEKKLIGG